MGFILDNIEENSYKRKGRENKSVVNTQMTDHCLTIPENERRQM